VEEVAEAFLALPQRGFCLLAFANVAEFGDAECAALVVDVLASGADVIARAILVQADGFEWL